MPLSRIRVGCVPGWPHLLTNHCGCPLESRFFFGVGDWSGRRPGSGEKKVSSQAAGWAPHQHGPNGSVASIIIMRGGLRPSLQRRNPHSRRALASVSPGPDRGRGRAGNTLSEVSGPVRKYFSFSRTRTRAPALSQLHARCSSRELVGDHAGCSSFNSQPCWLFERDVGACEIVQRGGYEHGLCSHNAGSYYTVPQLLVLLL